MSIIPLTVPVRPFSVNPTTHLMTVDGIFDVALGRQLIAVPYVPPEDINEECQVYVEVTAPSDSGIFLKGGRIKHTFATANPSGPLHQLVIPVTEPLLRKGQPSIRYLQADFTHAKVGKHPLRFKCVCSVPLEDSSLGPRTSALAKEWEFTKNIFVTESSWNHATNTYRIRCPEGALMLHFDRLIVVQRGSKDEWLLMQPAERRKLGPELILPSAVNVEIEPAVPFEGQYGPFPFQDPLWKVIGLFVSAVASIAGCVAYTPQDTAPGTGSCHTEPGSFGGTKGMCSYSPDPNHPNFWSGILGGVALAAAAVAASEGEDPIRAGERQTRPKSENERTVKESLKFKIGYEDNPTPGYPFKIASSWIFTRHTDFGKAYSHKENWARVNDHCLRTVARADRATYEAGQTATISASLVDRKSGKVIDSGLTTHVVAWLFGPGGRCESIVLQYDSASQTYVGKFNCTGSNVFGTWRFTILAQTINGATSDMRPEDAAAYLGGLLANDAVSLDLIEGCNVSVNYHGAFDVSLT